MQLTRRVISVCATALTAMAIAMPAQTAQAAPRPAQPAGVSSADPGLRVALTNAQVRARGWSLTEPTNVQLNTGGHVTLTPASDTARSAADIHARGHWYKIDVFFNKHETLILATGTAACANFAGKIPEVGWAIAMYCGAISIYAGYVAASSRCVKVTKIVGVTVPYWSSYRGKWCS
jgi:hypothetical protein